MTPEIRAADEVDPADLAAVLGTRGSGARCSCQRYKLAPREAFHRFPAEERAERLRAQTCAPTTTGLVAFVDGTPAGWCAVEPRTEYVGLVRVAKVPWEGRDEDRADPSVWAVTCFLTRAGYRRRGIATALAAATLGHARQRGARAVEGYPITRTDVLLEELHVGTLGMFLAAGFTEVHRPTPRRAVVRAPGLP